jgi:hypothetical protein
MRLIDYLRWAELHIKIAVHELSHLVLAIGHGPNRYNFRRGLGEDLDPCQVVVRSKIKVYHAKESKHVVTIQAEFTSGRRCVQNVKRIFGGLQLQHSLESKVTV